MVFFNQHHGQVVTFQIFSQTPLHPLQGCKVAISSASFAQEDKPWYGVVAPTEVYPTELYKARAQEQQTLHPDPLRIYLLSFR